VALRTAALCAGYGGLELGVRAALPGVQLVVAVERQAYAAAVLASRMEEGSLDSCPIWDDLESFDGRAWRGCVDLVVAGFPCQGASVAGKRLGIDDARWLWPEVWRITRECGASMLFVENVPGLLSVNQGQALERILGDLASCGWAAEWDCVPAAAVGAPHLRDRFFLLAADTNRIGVRVEPERDQRSWGGERKAQCGQGEPDDDGAQGNVAYAAVNRRKTGGSRHERSGQDRIAHGGDEHRGLDPGDREETQSHVHADGYGNADPGERWQWRYAPVPVVRRVDDGTATELDEAEQAERLHLLGNGVVPQQAAKAFTTLWQRLTSC
jgi:DNA (cytosine-5)-methyltransferase 1